MKAWFSAAPLRLISLDLFECVIDPKYVYLCFVCIYIFQHLTPGSFSRI